jgi:hypothetical protein
MGFRIRADFAKIFSQGNINKLFKIPRFTYSSIIYFQVFAGKADIKKKTNQPSAESGTSSPPKIENFKILGVNF